MQLEQGADQYHPTPLPQGSSLAGLQVHSPTETGVGGAGEQAITKREKTKGGPVFCAPLTPNPHSRMAGEPGAVELAR